MFLFYGAKFSSESVQSMPDNYLNKSLYKDLKPLTPIPTGLDSRGSLDRDISCMLFDIYGTLFISAAGDISIAGKRSEEIGVIGELLDKYNIPRAPDTILTDLSDTIQNTHLVLKEKGIDYPEVDIIRIWKRVLRCDDTEILRAFATEFEMIVNPVWPMPNLRELLSELGKQNITMGIISNAQFYTLYLFEWFLGAEIESLGFHPALTLLSYQFGYAKPSFCLFETAADRLKAMGLDPAQTLYIGNDMLKDIYPAMKTGFKTALFAGDSRSLKLREEHPLCRGIAPDLVITDLIQLNPGKC